ncbi:MAG TPA: GNAT family N-acetyltransferase [Longimicrobiales bacterium]|nr:GNAT family N-acetyltransferase [Longimicrobiales bacterium]
MEIEEVTPERWPDFERLFESRGAPSYCWCMAWRGTAREKRENTDRKAAMRERVLGGVPVGLLGYVDGEPVAWCSVAPRDTYRPLGGVSTSAAEDAATWSIVCFFVRREHRKRGMLRELLEAAVEHARRRGARVVEAYPVDPDSPSYRFMGFVSAFADAGFREVGMAGTRRHVMRLELGRRKRAG